MARLSQSSSLGLVFVIVGALLLCIGALGVVTISGKVAFEYVANIWFILAILVWAVLAWTARRFIVGRVGETPANSLPVLIWGAFRVCLLLATVILLVCWLVALALGHGMERPMLQAVVLIVVVTAVSGIIGGATLNSLLAIRHWQHRKSG
ncbi:MAG: hypothetical protein V4696_11300 [Pseudomonadota bacterium]